LSKFSYKVFFQKFLIIKNFFKGLANVDELMVELLLPEDAETRSYSRLRTSVTSSIVQSNVTSPNPPATSSQILQIPGIVTATTLTNSQSVFFSIFTDSPRVLSAKF
jgi:hypothetical protein